MPIETPHLWITLNKIKTVLGFSDAQMSNILHLTPKEYTSFKERNASPSVFSIMQLSEFLEVGFIPLMSGQVDYRALAARMLKNSPQMPERYTRAAYSKRRTPLYMLDYITDLFGEVQRQSILRHLQVNEALFQDRNAPINLLFTTDLCEYLKKYNLMTDTELIGMGKYSSKSARSPIIINPLASTKSVKEMYELMCAELLVSHFEKNNFYHPVKASKHHCTIVGHPNQEIEEELGLKNAGTSAVCLLRSGFVSTVPNFLGLPHARIKKTACVHQGDPECRYEIDYEHAERVFSLQKAEMGHQGLWLS